MSSVWVRTDLNRTNTAAPTSELLSLQSYFQDRPTFFSLFLAGMAAGANDRMYSHYQPVNWLESTSNFFGVSLCFGYQWPNKTFGPGKRKGRERVVLESKFKQNQHSRTNLQITLPSKLLPGSTHLLFFISGWLLSKVLENSCSTGLWNRHSYQPTNMEALKTSGLTIS